MLYALDDRRVELRGSGHFVAPNASLIGRVVLEDRASVWFNVVIRGDNDPIVIGARSNVQDGSILHTDDGVPLTLGEDVSVGHAVVLHGCTIGNGSLIGIKAVVLNRAVIGRDCLVGAGALIPEGKIIPDRGSAKPSRHSAPLRRKRPALSRGIRERSSVGESTPPLRRIQSLDHPPELWPCAVSHCRS